MSETLLNLKNAVQIKVERSEGVRCIGYAKSDSKLSCGPNHGALATLTVKIKYATSQACDADSMKVKNYKINYVSR